jgi:competence protein ComEA
MIIAKKVVTLFVVLSMMLVFTANGYTADKTSAAVKGKGLININTGGVDQLVKLPRIGEKMAQRIIDYRKKNGKFKRIEDVMKVKGIGEKTFKGFEKMITI